MNANVLAGGNLSKLAFETKRAMSLINPADTYMVNFKVFEDFSHYIPQNLMTTGQSVVQML